jgi:hypothetical protein
VIAPFEALNSSYPSQLVTMTLSDLRLSPNADVRGATLGCQYSSPADFGLVSSLKPRSRANDDDEDLCLLPNPSTKDEVATTAICGNITSTITSNIQTVPASVRG